MRRMRATTLTVTAGSLCLALGLAAASAAQTAPAPVEAPVPPTPSAVPDTPQSILGPGMYVFQTRTRSATCGDDEATGFVDSFIAPIHGVPGARRMTMHLLNSQWWSDWTIVVNANDEIFGDSLLTGGSGANRPSNHFMVTRRDAARHTGLGVRTYAGAGGRPCQVFFDALLRRVDI